MEHKTTARSLSKPSHSRNSEKLKKNEKIMMAKRKEVLSMQPAPSTSVLGCENSPQHPLMETKKRSKPTVKKRAVAVSKDRRPVSVKNKSTAILNSNTPAPLPRPTIITGQVNPLIPNLTEDMFIIEAASLIVPILYEKPPAKGIKEFIQEQFNENRDGYRENNKEKCDGEEDNSDGRNMMERDDRHLEEEIILISNDVTEVKKSSYFDRPSADFFMNIGLELVQERVQTDQLKRQKRKNKHEGGSNPETVKTIESLAKDLALRKENNRFFKTPLKKCKYCNFKTESSKVMSHHLLTPHVKNSVYYCNFCDYKAENSPDILIHMKAEHGIKGHLEETPNVYQCPNCPFERNEKGKLTRHMVSCTKNFKAETNLAPIPDLLDILKMVKPRQSYSNNALFKNTHFYSKMPLQSAQNAPNRDGGQPILDENNQPKKVMKLKQTVRKRQTKSAESVAVVQNQGPSRKRARKHRIAPAYKTVTPSSWADRKLAVIMSENNTVFCEICDGYVKNVDVLRNHFKVTHKIYIHPTLIYEMPNVKCLVCPIIFFSEQGVERHLLTMHGLITHNLQRIAADKQDLGVCNYCGKIFVSNLLGHIGIDHRIPLKLMVYSHKCVACAVAFDTQKKFERHVFSTHNPAEIIMGGYGILAKSSNSSDQVLPLNMKRETAIILKPIKMLANGLPDFSIVHEKTNWKH